ncbi:hypothetical protein [Aureimonas sp. Leaf454]|uniref:hypothetical protein n=1 Tax=Aureimonas sp. Leaf454 TaxID=1736381 RepID=UPI000A734E31|nr:hypothetical protein [Aureimonas sp. Leaf454]
MSRMTTVDRELKDLIRDVIAAELLEPGSKEMAVAEAVAERGQGSLDSAQREIWERRVLPILSKPLNEQIAIAAIIRRGGYVPRKIQL